MPMELEMFGRVLRDGAWYLKQNDRESGNWDKVQDSGVREDFDTGSRRDTRKGKGRYDLISPIAMERLAVHMENGANKYDARNWEKGQPVSRYLDSAFRHLYKHLGGSKDEDHLAAALWNIHCMIHTEEKITRGELPGELNDLPLPRSESTP